MSTSRRGLFDDGVSPRGNFDPEVASTGALDAEFLAVSTGTAPVDTQEWRGCYPPAQNRQTTPSIMY